MATKKTIQSAAAGEAKPLTARQRIARLKAKYDVGAESGSTARSDVHALDLQSALHELSQAEGRKLGPPTLKKKSDENKAVMREFAAYAFKNPEKKVDGKSIAHDLDARAKWVLEMITVRGVVQTNKKPYAFRTVKDYIGKIGP